MSRKDLATETGDLTPRSFQRAAWISFALLMFFLPFVGCETNTPPAVSKPDAASVQSAETPAAAVANAAGEPTEPQASENSQDDGIEQVVRVKILRGPNTEPIEGTVPWTAGTTVFAAISALSPAVALESTGQGESLFVKSIAGQANLGSAGDNWIYRVNGQLGDRSCGVYELQAGDEVVWSFGKYE
ncbi:MAG: DUF4430 domain-containing protein [Planctomycetaceae bacterium]|nr:DUF4430 domain-containing protein [Planctomycetaceae bacterium]